MEMDEFQESEDDIIHWDDPNFSKESSNSLFNQKTSKNRNEAVKYLAEKYEKFLVRQFSGPSLALKAKLIGDGFIDTTPLNLRPEDNLKIVPNPYDKTGRSTILKTVRFVQDDDRAKRQTLDYLIERNIKEYKKEYGQSRAVHNMMESGKELPSFQSPEEVRRDK